MNPEFMMEAIRLARESVRAGEGGPFGAVVVHSGAIVGRGRNRVTSSFDPTAHAEVLAIREACARLKSFQLQGCEIYTSCEPCPMCLSAIYWARLERVFFANTRQDAASIGFDDDFIYRQVALPAEARAVSMRQLLREEAMDVFEEWRNKPDKVRY